jgi:glycosyltransferase involved in cell wall biosynthesis
LLLGWLTRRAAGLLCIGTANREYWRNFGARPEQEIDACYAVDQSLFRYAGDAARSDYRRRHGIEGRFVVLFVGRLIERKRLPLLLEAFATAARQRPELSLFVAGDGPGRPSFEDWKARHPELHVVDLQRVRYNEMPALYSACDVLACPYENEPWGLTINEAMCCALPVIASTSGTVGAAIDLVMNDVTGVALDRLDEPTMTAAIVKLAGDDETVKRMRAGTVALMHDWTYERAARGFAELASRVAPE